MARKHEGFTIALIPHSAQGKGREIRITGGRVPLFGALVIFLALLIGGAIYISASGFLRYTGIIELNRRIEILEDSLASAVDIESRLQAIEEQLEDVRNTRRVIENLATQGIPPEE